MHFDERSRRALIHVRLRFDCELRYTCSGGARENAQFSAQREDYFQCSKQSPLSFESNAGYTTSSP